MKILLAPSETKTLGGEGSLNLDSLVLNTINPSREEIISEYQKIVDCNNTDELQELFGVKKESEIQKYKVDIYNSPVKKAIERYSGVAFDYIDYSNLDKGAQEYIDENLLIFSNLFGVLRAKDLIPIYKLKQGSTINKEKIEKFYNTILKEPLDRYLESEDILDIRAGYYDKFYKPNKPYTTLKFLKNGKVVSHWAKAYRGMALKYAAINQIDSIDKFISMHIPTLELLEIRKVGLKQEIIYKIEE